MLVSEALPLQDLLNNNEEMLVLMHLARNELREVPMFHAEVIEALTRLLGDHLHEAPQEMTMEEEDIQEELREALTREDLQDALNGLPAPPTAAEETLLLPIVEVAEILPLPIDTVEEVIEALIATVEAAIALLLAETLIEMILEIIVRLAMIETTRKDRDPPTKTINTIDTVLTQNEPTTAHLLPHLIIVAILLQNLHLRRNLVEMAQKAAVVCVKCRRTK